MTTTPTGEHHYSTNADGEPSCFHCGHEPWMRPEPCLAAPEPAAPTTSVSTSWRVALGALRATYGVRCGNCFFGEPDAEGNWARCTLHMKQTPCEDWCESWEPTP